MLHPVPRALGRDGCGKETREFSERFSQPVLESVGTSARAKMLYSFRHLLNDRCREADLGEELHDAPTGHSRGAGRGYGAGVSVKRLAEGMARVMPPSCADSGALLGPASAARQGSTEAADRADA